MHATYMLFEELDVEKQADREREFRQTCIDGDLESFWVTICIVEIDCAAIDSFAW
jgi:hypothetical protein